MLDFIKELTRRKVWLFGGIYLALGWVLLQVAIAVETTMELPDWIDQSVLVLLVTGFPVALLLAWAQESNAASPLSADPQANGSTGTRPSFSIAVLPFDDLSRDGTFQEVSEGVPEDILTQLSFHENLKVAARNSSFVFKESAIDIREVGKKLDVGFVLEGSFRKVGTSARITAQLIDARTGDHIWSDNFDRPMEALDADLDLVVDTIVQEVYTAVAGLELERLLERNREDLSIPNLVSLAAHYTGSASLSTLREAEKIMTEALSREPGSGPCNSYMAQIQAALPAHGSGSRSEHWALAAKYLEKAKLAGSPDWGTLFP